MPNYLTTPAHEPNYSRKKNRNWNKKVKSFCLVSATFYTLLKFESRKELRDCINLNNCELKELKESLQNTNNENKALKTSLDPTNEQLKATKEKFRIQTEDIVQLWDNIEQYTRKNSIKLQGIRKTPILAQRTL